MKMKTILVAADFSQAAKSALDFAIVLAKQIEARLVVIHAYSLPVSFLPGHLDREASEASDFVDHISEKLRLLCARIDAAGDLRYSYKAVEGPVVETVVREAGMCEAGLVIIGNKGLRDMIAHFVGSAISGIIEKSPCPVISVPQAFKLTGPLIRITYATAFQRSDLGSIRALAALAGPMNAELCMLHVSADRDGVERVANRLNVLAKRVEGDTGFTCESCELLIGDDVQEELSRYIAAGRTGMLVLSTAYRT